MIVIAVIVLMASAALPAVNSYLTRHSVRYAADELYGDIQLARLRAARNNQRCRILINTPAVNQYTIRDVDNNNNPLGVFKIGDLGKFRGNITFTNSPDAAEPPPYQTLEFLSQGVRGTILPANSNSIYLTNQGNDTYYRVLVSAAGGTSIDRWLPDQNQWK
jgi:type II secretory pathway pseudopilin PulG